MWEAIIPKKYLSLLLSLMVGMTCFETLPAAAGPYRDSAHGSSEYGVKRSTIDAKYEKFARGNCEHCHETHASLEGVEPEPALGPASHTLFATSFNTGRTLSPYQQADNFCFYCHNDNSGPQVQNHDYSSTFGGGDPVNGPQSIMAALNQSSYHNLYDIWDLLKNDPLYGTWFAKRGNPCSACHNSHIAKRNWDSSLPNFPLLSAISIPGASGSWGEIEVMSVYSSYEAPYALPGISREPAGYGDQDGTNTPDYVGFCTSCHDPDRTISSTTLNREIKKISWVNTGLNPDKHGVLSRDGTDIFREPYETAAATKSNFVLSCLDCHESHGSENIMLLRRRINGENMEGVVNSTDIMGTICRRCHQDDQVAAAGTNQINSWQFVHHQATAAPYTMQGGCACHGGEPGPGGQTPIPCGNCHGHGMDDSWVPVQQSVPPRKTF